MKLLNTMKNLNPTTTPHTILANNIADFEGLCKQHMLSNSLQCNVPLRLNGSWQRYSADSNQLKKDEYYIGSSAISDFGAPFMICTYGSWSTSDNFTFKSFEAERDRFTPYELKELNTELRKHNEVMREKWAAEQAVRHREAKKDAARKYGLAKFKTADIGYFEYLIKKQVNIFHNDELPIKYTIHDGHKALMIPLIDSDGTMWSAQYIYTNQGTTCKRFHKGGKKRGNFYVLGGLHSSKRIFVCEGYATGASIYEAIKEPVVITFDAGNIEAVCREWRLKYSNLDIIICADNDKAGLEPAVIASDLYNCKVIAPTDVNDFNDMACANGVESVKSYIEKFIREKGVQQDTLDHSPAKKKDITMLTKKHLKSRFLKINSFNIDDPCANFTIEALPGDLKVYAQNLLDTSPAHPVVVITSMFASLSALLGRKLTYSRTPSDNGENIISIWMFTVSESGSFKSKGLSDGHRIIKLLDFDICQKIKEIKKDNLQATEEKLEKLIAEQERKLVDAPVYSSSTARVRCASDHDVCLVTASEGSGFLGDLRQTWNPTGKQQLVNMYDGEKIESDAIGRKKIVVKNPFFSVVGGSTESFLVHDIDHSDLSTGFLARLLFYRIPDEELYPEDDEYIIEDKAEVNKDIQRIIYKHIQDYKPIILRLSKEAKELGRDIKRHVINSYLRVIDPEGKFKAFPRRWMVNIEKFAAIIQVFIDLRDSQASAVISEEAMAIAYGFIEPAIESTIHLFRKVFVTSDMNEKIASVLTFIRDEFKSRGAVTLREIKQKRDFLFKKEDPLLPEKIEEILIKQEQIEKIKKGRTFVLIPINMA